VMRVRVIEEHGYEVALLGLSLSYGRDPATMEAVARRLGFKGDGHNKFLESIVVWMDIDAPRYFWQQFDTYRVGVTKQSESTMHTMTARTLGQTDFAYPIPQAHLEHLNRLVRDARWEEVKRDLPESFLQRRIVCQSYLSLQRIIRQRKAHRLTEWSTFVTEVLRQVQHPELLDEEEVSPCPPES
jgi:hypothetical protein